jgi:hypothetical protein
MKKQPLAEVFGFPIDNLTAQAKRHRDHALCRFGNRVPNCTKDKANNPLGVCSIYDGTDAVITCPIRFREQWLIAEDAASFFFPKDSKWTTLTEVKLKDKYENSAGNIDVVICSYDDTGKITDFGALEIQAVYISGNIRNPFEKYIGAPNEHSEFDWSKNLNYPKPDYLSSSRKRLAPQLIFKGGIIKAWGKKISVAISRGFFQTLPALQEVEPSNADIGWFVYELVRDTSTNLFALKRWNTIYTKFNDSLEKITRSEPGKMEKFIDFLQEKVDEKLDKNDLGDVELIDAPF